MKFEKTVRQNPAGKSKSSAAPVKVMNTPTVKIDNSFKPKPMPPTLRLSSDDLAAVKGWKVGGKYKLSLEVEETSMRQGNEYYGELSSEDGGGTDSKVSATFKVTSIKEA